MIQLTYTLALPTIGAQLTLRMLRSVVLNTKLLSNSYKSVLSLIRLASN